MLSTATDRPVSTDVLIPKFIAEAYSRNLNIKRFERRLQMLLELLGSYKTVKDIEHLIVTTQTICEMLTTIQMAREMFSKVNVQDYI